MIICLIINAAYLSRFRAALSPSCAPQTFPRSGRALRRGAFRRTPHRPLRRRRASVGGSGYACGATATQPSCLGRRQWAFPFRGGVAAANARGPAGRAWRGRPHVARCTPGPAPAARGESVPSRDGGRIEKRDVISNTRFSRRVSVHTSHLPRVAVMFVSWAYVCCGARGAALPKTLDTSHNLSTVYRVPL